MWQIELSEEVAEWLSALNDTDFVAARRKLDLLATEGPMLRMPHAKYLGQKLYELRQPADHVHIRRGHEGDHLDDLSQATAERGPRSNPRPTRVAALP